MGGGPGSGLPDEKIRLCDYDVFCVISAAAGRWFCAKAGNIGDGESPEQRDLRSHDLQAKLTRRYEW